MNDFKLYEVGGKIRDEFLGLKSKDVDYTVVPDDELLKLNMPAWAMFEVLEGTLREEGFDIFLITKDCYTIRAKFPANHKYQGVADFVMARKEVGYIEGTRTPIVEPGNLYDDLSRRDFTINAIAKDEDGNYIDYFHGQADIKNRVIRTPLDPKATLDDDPLRILRAIRFAITKGFYIEKELSFEMYFYDYKKKMGVVSEERIREELVKCFKYNTLSTLAALDHYQYLKDYIFKNTKLWLKPTSEQ